MILRARKRPRQYALEEIRKLNKRCVTSGRIGYAESIGSLVLWFRRLRRVGGKPKLVRHAHQIDHRFRMHLVRDLAAVNLDGHLAQPEMGGNLLVRPPGHDEH